MNVLFLTNLPSPYRVAFFNELSRYCNLTVIYERECASDRHKEWKSNEKITYKEYYLKGIRLGAESAFCPEIYKYLNSDEYDIITLSGYGTMTSIYSNILLHRKKKSFMIAMDGCLPREDNWLKYRLKSKLLRNSSAIILPGECAKKVVETYGVESNKICICPFTSLKEENVYNQCSNDEKTELRHELGMTEKKIVISVGQFIYRKGFDVLIRANEHIKADVGIYIIGGNPNEEYLELQRKFGGGRVHFIEFKKQEELAKYFKTADVFVLPTREDIWGLVVNEAMAHGLPVITTECCGAGIELIKDGINGYIVPIEDPIALAEKIQILVDSRNMRERVRENNLNIIVEYTIEKMAQRYAQIYKEYLDNKTLRC